MKKSLKKLLIFMTIVSCTLSFHSISYAAMKEEQLPMAEKQEHENVIVEPRYEICPYCTMGHMFESVSKDEYVVDHYQCSVRPDCLVTVSEIVYHHSKKCNDCGFGYAWDETSDPIRSHSKSHY